MKQKALFLFLLILSLQANGQSDNKLKDVFAKFQEGYTKRDTTLVEKFTTDLCAKDISIIGTGEDEWFQGIDAAKNLFKNDWAYWLQLKLDTANINIITSNNVAFFKVHGTVSIAFPDKETAYTFAFGQLQQSINREKTNKRKVLAYSNEASNFIQQIESGGLEITYSLRLSGALVKQNNKWLFKQLVFSFPYPMARK